MSEPGRYRVHARRSRPLQVVVWHPRGGWQRTADVVDVGLGGIGVTIDASLAPGDVVTVSFTGRPGSDRFPIEARVVWTAVDGDAESAPAHPRTRGGLVFLPRDPAALLALFELLASPPATS